MTSIKYGIIVITSHLFDQYRRHFERIKVPIVFINEQKPGETMHFVAVDDVRGTQLAVEHLIALGHQRIGYVSVTNRSKSNQYRLNVALVFNANHIEDHAKRGEASLEPLLAAGATAVFCYNDIRAMSLLATCYQRGLSVPGHLSVIGFDDIDMAAYTTPPPTTIRQPRFELGSWLCE